MNSSEMIWKTFSKPDDGLKDTYPMKKTDTVDTYFEALKTLNPFVHETLFGKLRNLIHYD